MYSSPWCLHCSMYCTHTLMPERCGVQIPFRIWIHTAMGHGPEWVDCDVRGASLQTRCWSPICPSLVTVSGGNGPISTFWRKSGITSQCCSQRSSLSVKQSLVPLVVWLSHCLCSPHNTRISRPTMRCFGVLLQQESLSVLFILLTCLTLGRRHSSYTQTHYWNTLTSKSG